MRRAHLALDVDLGQAGRGCGATKTRSQGGACAAVGAGLVVVVAAAAAVLASVPSRPDDAIALTSNVMRTVDALGAAVMAADAATASSGSPLVLGKVGNQRVDGAARGAR